MYELINENILIPGKSLIKLCMRLIKNYWKSIVIMMIESIDGNKLVPGDM